MTAALMILAALIAGALGIAAIIAMLMALVAGLGAAFAWGYTPVAAALYERRLRTRYEPLPPSQTYRPMVTTPDPAAVDADEYWTEARAASAAAEAVPAHGRHAGPTGDEGGPAEPSRTIGYTAVLPTVRTGVTWGFDGTPGSRVVEPAGGPRTATVAETVGRAAA